MTVGTLYKYFSPQRHTFFHKPMLRFTPPWELNDPFEGKPSYMGFSSQENFNTTFDENIDDIFQEQLQAIPKEYHGLLLGNEAMLKNFVKSKYPELISFLNSKKSREELDNSISSALKKSGVGVLSMSQLNNNLLMWAHYCKNHEGFVVGFDTSNSFFNRTLHKDDNIFRTLRPVIYKNERPRKHLTDYSSGENVFEDLLFTKSKDWEYELEWRMIISGVFEMKQYGFAGLDAVPVEAIKKIYIGVKARQELKDCAIYFCQKHGISNLYQMELHEADYALQPNPLNIKTV